MTVELVRPAHLGARALAATVLVMVGATAAHGWAGGRLPGPAELGLLAVVVLGCSLVALRSPRAPRWLLLVLVAGAQVGLHGVLGVLSVPGGHGAHGAHAAHAAHAAQAVDLWGLLSWQMLLAHAVGTALTALAWWACEGAVTAVLVVGRRLRIVITRAPALPPALPVRGGGSPALLCVAPRRGPPVGLHA